MRLLSAIFILGATAGLAALEPDPQAYAVPNPLHIVRDQRARIVVPLDWERASVEIWSVRGAFIRRLQPVPLEHGQEEWVWDGRNDERIACMPGTYLVRVRYYQGTAENGHVFPLVLTRPAER